MAEGDMGDLEDNQPDSSAPEDEQADQSPQQPIGECKNNKKNHYSSILLHTFCYYSKRNLVLYASQVVFLENFPGYLFL